MKQVVVSNAFKKDLKRIHKRNYDLSKLQKFIDLLQNGEISPKYKVHKMEGEWEDFFDAHIEPDWVLIFKVDKMCIHLARTGTHSDLF